MLSYESRAFSTQKINVYVKIDMFDLELLLVNRLHIVSKLWYNLGWLYLNLEFSMIGILVCILSAISIIVTGNLISKWSELYGMLFLLRGQVRYNIMYYSCFMNQNECCDMFPVIAYMKHRDISILCREHFNIFINYLEKKKDIKKLIFSVIKMNTNCEELPKNLKVSSDWTEYLTNKIQCSKV